MTRRAAPEAVERIVVLDGVYRDSIMLMAASKSLEELDGIIEAVVLAATPLNLNLLEDGGYSIPDGQLNPDSLVIAIRASTDTAAAEALDEVERVLHGTRSASDAPDQPLARSFRSVVRQTPGVNVALVSAPGAHAMREVSAALDAGLHCFCFSSGIDVRDEAALKAKAAERGRLLMGPDCGTSIIDGVGLGFANVVRRGPLGLIGASGTGLQELCCLLDQAGVGISHAIGLGSRDLTLDVGGTMALLALRLLGADPSTQALVLVSKPPHPDVTARVRDEASRIDKPVVMAFLGSADAGEEDHGMRVVSTIEEAARAAASIVGVDLPLDDTAPVRETPGHIRGLFSGGSLCYETMGVVSRAVGPVFSNIPLHEEWRLENLDTSRDHTFIDFGDEVLTEGRPHPMIDPRLRNERLEREIADPGVGVVVMDVVLGYGAHPDPAGTLLPLLERARDARADDLTVVVDVCGSSSDPQGLEAQRAALTGAGAVVASGSAAAGRLALRAAGAEAPTR